MNRSLDHPAALTRPDAPTTRKAPRWLPLGAVAGPILFTLAWLVLGFLSPGYTLWEIRIDPYSPISQPISGLGLGETAPYMNAAFVLNGLLIIAGVIAIFSGIPEMSTVGRGTCAGLLAIHGLGSIVSGIFTLQSAFEHFIGFLLALTPIVSFLIVARLLRPIPYWGRFGSWLRWASPLTLVLAVLFFATFDPTAAGDALGIGGLTQRILIVEIQAWFAVMGWLAFRRSSSVATHADDHGSDRLIGPVHTVTTSIRPGV